MSYGVLTTSFSLPNNDFKSAYVGIDYAYKLCFNSGNFYITVQTPYGTNSTLIESTKTKNNPDRFSLPLPNRWNCEGFRAPWIIKSWKTYRNDTEDVGTGYLFRTLTNQNYCNDGKNFPTTAGPGMFVRVINASQINRFNNPNYHSVFGSISKFILDYSRAYSRSTRDLLPYLNFDEEIEESQSSPLILSSPANVNMTLSSAAGTNFNIRDTFVGIVIQRNTSDIPLSEFTFVATSSDPTIAEVINQTTVTLKRSGTFVLTVTQLFYQNINFNVGYLEKTFDINIYIYLLN